MNSPSVRCVLLRAIGWIVEGAELMWLAHWIVLNPWLCSSLQRNHEDLLGDHFFADASDGHHQRQSPAAEKLW